MRLSVIVPAYNESANIVHRINSISRVLTAEKLQHEIIVVDDGSTDNTRRAAEAMKIRHKNLNVVGYSSNRGKGAAVIFGAGYAKGDYIAFIDADRDIDPKYLVFLLKNIGNAYIAILSKNHPESKVEFPAYRKILSKGYYALVRVLFNLPVSDTQVGCKVFRRSVIKKICPLVSTGRFAFDLELLVYAHRFGFAIREFPAVLSFSRSKGRIRLKGVLRMLADTLVILYKVRVKQK